MASSSLWAAETNTTTTNTNTATAEKTLPYGDNPSLGRVLLYKTGKSMQNLGESIQGASENTSQKMSERWKNTKEYTAEQSEIVQEQTQKAKQFTLKNGKTPKMRWLVQMMEMFLLSVLNSANRHRIKNKIPLIKS